MAKIIYPELSYKLVGICIDVFKNIGGGYQEKYYQRAVGKALEQAAIPFKPQLKIDLSFKGEKIGRYFIDFVIENKIVLELKSGSLIYARDIKQVLAYLESSGLELGIIALFKKRRVIFKRILRGFTQ